MTPLKIEVHLDRTQAAQAAREHIADAKKMTEANRASAVQQKKDIQESWREILDSVKETNKAIEKDTKEVRQRIASESVKRARDSAKAIADAQRDANKAGLELEAMEARKAMTQQEVIQAARVGMIQDENRARIDKLKQQMIGFKDAAANQKSGWQMMGDGAIGAGKALLSVVSSYAALGTAVYVVHQIAQMWHDQRKDIEASADALAKQRDVALEIAALRDRMGQSTHESFAQLEFRSKTLQTASAAQALQEGALNTGQATMGAGFIDKANFDKLVEYTGAYQAARPSVNASALGNLAGTLPGLGGGKNQTGEDAFRRLTGIAKTFDIGSSDLGSAVAQFQATSSLTKSGLYKPGGEQQAALQSYFSTFVPDRAGERVDQFTRATLGSLGRMRAAGVEGSEPVGDYYKGLGATNQMDPIEIGNLVAADFKKQEELEKAKGLAFSPMDYLKHKGFGNMEDARALMEYSAGVNSGSMKPFADRMTPASAPTFNEAILPVRQFQAVDPVAQNRRPAIAKDIADFNKGVGPEEWFLSEKRAAFERLRGDPKSGVYGTFEQSNNSTLWEGRILDELQRDMVKRARAANVPLPEGEGDVRDSLKIMDAKGFNSMGGMGYHKGILGGDAFDRLATSNETRAKFAYDLNNKIIMAGGEGSNNTELLEAARRGAAAQEATEKMLREFLQKQMNKNPDPTMPSVAGDPGPPAPGPRP